MNQRITIQYNPLTKDLEIVENEFSTFEAFGIMEAAKQMIANSWLKEPE